MNRFLAKLKWFLSNAYPRAYTCAWLRVCDGGFKDYIELLGAIHSKPVTLEVFIDRVPCPKCAKATEYMVRPLDICDTCFTKTHDPESKLWYALPVSEKRYTGPRQVLGEMVRNWKVSLADMAW